MEKQPTLRDLPAIFRIAKHKYQNGNSDYLADTDVKRLVRGGVSPTRRNAWLYNTGGATATALFIVGAMLFFCCNPQEFVRQPGLWRVLESTGPLFVSGLLYFAAKHLSPAFAVGIRSAALQCLISYILLCLVYNIFAL